jgi:cell division protease FtsH
MRATIADFSPFLSSRRSDFKDGAFPADGEEVSSVTTVPFSTTADGVPFDYLELDPPMAKALIDNKAKIEGLMSGKGTVSTTVVPKQSVTEKVQQFGADWQGFASLLFIVLFAVVMWRTLKSMPKTKPVEIKPDANVEVAWSDIAGVDEAKKELQEVVDFLKDSKRFKKLGARVPAGVLLHGPPGTGKTLLAKAVANESGATFYAQSASSFVEMFAGLGAARIRRLFREAAKNEPAIIFIDELDAVGATRGSDNNSEREQTLNQLLVEMDGFSSSGRIVVMAASNLLEKLDPALLRPGRFDRQVYVSPPDVEGRERILEVHTANKPLRPDVDLHVVAQQTSGLSGAELANLCNEAAIFAARRSAQVVAREDFENALERVVAGVQSNTTLNEHERRVVAYHEAGHALTRELLASTERTHKISIVPRGSALGFVMNLPDEDSYLKTREELVDQMTVLLGGRVAEAIVFGAVTTGAANDLHRVAEITHAMVHEYGMGTATASVRAVTDADIVSDLTRRIRDEEQQELAFEAQRAAYDLITAHRPKLEEIATALLERETLDRAELDAIMSDTPPVARRRPPYAVPDPAETPTPPERPRIAAVTPLPQPGGQDDSAA